MQIKSSLQADPHAKLITNWLARVKHSPLLMGADVNVLRQRLSQLVSQFEVRTLPRCDVT
jgi:hypothetical protein